MTVLLVGWGLGWLTARAVITDPIRRLLSGVAEALSTQAPDEKTAERFIANAIAAPFRFLSALTHCAACSGFWWGVGLAQFGSAIGVVSPWDTIPTGLAVMGVNALADAVLVGALSLTALDQPAPADRGEHG